MCHSRRFSPLSRLAIDSGISQRGIATLVFQSLVLQYLDDHERARVRAAIEAAGASATERAPLAWLRMEPGGELADVRLRTWPGDGGIFHNFGLTHTRHPETGKRNLGLYRLHQHSHDTLGMHWQIHKDSTAHHAVAERRGERLPVAVAFSPDPVVTYAAQAPLPADIDEYLFAGFLNRDRIDLVDCVSVPLQVPAAAQVVLEGWVEPGARRPEGPFGDHTGFYTPVEEFPFVRVECMTMQRDPVFQSIVVGRPPQEDGPLGKATERFFLPLIKLLEGLSK